MKKRAIPIFGPLWGWFPINLCWVATVGMFVSLNSFRAVKTAGIARAIDFADVPMLQFFDSWYFTLYWVAAACSVTFLVVSGFWCRKHLSSKNDPSQMQANRRPRRVIGLFYSSFVAFVSLSLWSCRFSVDSASDMLEVQATNPCDWTALALLLLVTLLLPRLIRGFAPEPAASTPLRIETQSGSFLTRLCLVYLLGSASIFLYSLRKHWTFFYPDANGGYDYRPFFGDSEMSDTYLVLYSTSLLFASLAAFGGCVLFFLFRFFTRKARSTGNVVTEFEIYQLSVPIAILWSMVMTIPWQIKLLPEIRAEQGWILPAEMIVGMVAVLFPMLYLSGLMLKFDFSVGLFERESNGEKLQAEFFPRRSEIAFWVLLLFPIYPLLRWLRIAGPRFFYAVLMLLSVVAVAGDIWLVNVAVDLYDFEDWRGMLHTAEFPFLRVFFAMLAAGLFYLVAMRVAPAIGHMFSRKDPDMPATVRSRILQRFVMVSLILLSVSNLAAATFPFWGWNGIHKNVFARTVEFNYRHEFEISFLHWLFDYDRDGYSAVLHGGDPNDFDADIQAGGIPAPKTVVVPIDKFAIADKERAKNFPNLVILYLEGVTPRAISAYGYRDLPDGLKATPNIDSVAAEGTLFTQARCHYPSTWDAWFAVCSGRYLRFHEMDMSHPFGDRYSRYNNLYKVLELAGVKRWCHADTPPYFEALVPSAFKKDSKTAWKTRDTGYSSRLSDAESESEMWTGDKRNKRMLDFLDSLKPGEKFFLTEHMSDTHFPWDRTSRKRAEELGFQNGLKKYEADALLPHGGTDEMYKKYFQTITRMDAQIGQIIHKLKAKKLWDHTIFIIVGDHGCQWWEHEHMYYVSHLYDQSLNVPLIVRVPGFPGGVTYDQPVLQIDLLPTMMELTGVRHSNPNADYPMTNCSLVSVLKGEDDESTAGGYWNRDMLLTTHYDMLGVISRFRYKLIYDRPAGTYLLFDLKKDPGENKNLADARPDLLAEMLEKLRKLVARHQSFIGQIKRGEPSD